MRKLIFSALVVAAAMAHAQISRAAIIYSTPGSSHTENFDTGARADGSTGLPNNSAGQTNNASLGITGTANYGWRDDFGSSTAGNWSIRGWHILHPTNAPGTAGVDQEGGFGGNRRMRYSTGSGNAGSFYSFGSASNSAERALGVVNSNTLSGTTPTSLPVSMGAVFTNGTGRRLTEMSLSYYGEQWRDGGSNGGTPVAQSLSFEYSFDATTVYDATATWHAVSALDFTSPVFANTATGATVNGNTVGRQLRSVTAYDFFGSGWLPGTNLWIRWNDRNDAGNDHGLAIDDLNFSAEIPEPASFVLVVLGAVAMLGKRRVR